MYGFEPITYGGMGADNQPVDIMGESSSATINAEMNEAMVTIVVEGNRKAQMQALQGQMLASMGAVRLDPSPLGLTKMAELEGDLSFGDALSAAGASLAGGWGVAVAEPTPVGEIVMGAATIAVAGVMYYQGNTNYPGPWSTTYEHPSQNPINWKNNDNNENNIGNGFQWMVAARLSYEFIDSFNYKPNPIPTQRDNTNVVTPKFFPYVPK